MKTKTERTSRGLANTLFDELDALRNGDSTPQQSRAKAAVANSIISLSRLEMEYARFVADSRMEAGALRALPMGKLPAKIK